MSKGEEMGNLEHNFKSPAYSEWRFTCVVMRSKRARAVEDIGFQIYGLS